MCWRAANTSAGISSQPATRVSYLSTHKLKMNQFGRRDDVDGPVAHNQPLVLRCWEHDKTATFGPHAAVRISTAAQQWHDSRNWPQAQLKANSNGEIRAPLFKSPVRMTAKSSMHRSRMSSNNAMHTDLRLAHSLLMWTMATVQRSTTGQTPSRTCQ